MTLLYRNPLGGPDGIADWHAEGPVRAATRGDALELASAGGDSDHWTLWCPVELPDGIRITWEFSPRAEPGLAMLFFGARAVGGGGILDDDVATRTGAYPEYHSGDIRTLHVSYFRRRWEDERAFHTCNLRKSPGFHLVAQGADPLPPVADSAERFYRIAVEKEGARVSFSIDDLPLFTWRDDGTTGPLIGAGRIGFRQMAPLIACYRNLEIHSL